MSLQTTFHFFRSVYSAYIFCRKIVTTTWREFPEEVGNLESLLFARTEDCQSIQTGGTSTNMESWLAYDAHVVYRMPLSSERNNWSYYNTQTSYWIICWNINDLYTIPLYCRISFELVFCAESLPISFWTHQALRWNTHILGFPIPFEVCVPIFKIIMILFLSCRKGCFLM